MTEPTFDRDGYPTEKTLKAIRKWKVSEIRALMYFIISAWNTDYGSVVCGNGSIGTPDTYSFVTGGWSGNEELIGAFSQNIGAWALTWAESHRGGLHKFEVPK